MSSIARMLDANCNRAREALRVMEDAARFALNDEPLSAALKSLRHDLRETIAHFPAGWLEANRDTHGDVGTSITTAAEMSRANLGDVVIAAGKRLTEALRVMEEAGKTFDANAAGRIEALRYRAYDLDQRLVLRFGSGHAQQWRLCLLLTKSLCKRPWREVLAAAIDGGVDCVQVREKDMDAGELVAHVREVIAIARGATASDRMGGRESAVRTEEDERSHGLPCGPSRGTHSTVIVNDRADIAHAAGADGLHLGQTDMGVRDVRRIAGRNLIVGVSTHDLNEAQRAVEDGADYCGVGAVFGSSTKQRETSGIAYLKQFIERFPHTPHLAIGGIAPANVGEVIAAGAKGVAVSAAICRADDPAAVVRSICASIGDFNNVANTNTSKT